MAVLEEWWSDESPDYPTCRVCKKQIGSEEAEEQGDETYEPEVALRVWRDHPTKQGEKQELAFHFACAPKELLP
jgi:hypothetical protein